MPRDIPIIFSGTMVRALLDGRKTMTRRLASSPLRKCKVGDKLWVREAWAGYIEKIKGVGECPWAHYRATDEDNFLPGMKWKPSIHMPRWASRLTLVVTAVKIEPLQDISEADAMAEGWERRPEISSDPDVHRDAARDWFSDLWSSLHGVESWSANPEVVVLSFRVVRGNIDRTEP